MVLMIAFPQNVPRGTFRSKCSMWERLSPGPSRGVFHMKRNPGGISGEKLLLCSREWKNSSFVFPLERSSWSVPRGTYTSIGTGLGTSATGIDQEAALCSLGEERARGRPSAQCSTWNIQFLQFLRSARRGDFGRAGNARNVPRGTFCLGWNRVRFGANRRVFHVEHCCLRSRQIGWIVRSNAVAPTFVSTTLVNTTISLNKFGLRSSLLPTFTILITTLLSILIPIPLILSFLVSRSGGRGSRKEGSEVGRTSGSQG
jgi:hypothetical protein